MTPAIGGERVKLFTRIFKMNFPEIMEIELPAEAVFRDLVFVSIKKTCPIRAYKIGHDPWGTAGVLARDT